MADNQISELKPCPFCGKPAELRETKHIPEGIDYTPRCTDTSCPGRCSKKYSVKETAISMWNKRNYLFGGGARKKSHEMDQSYYVVGCFNYASAEQLYMRLRDYLYDEGIGCRAFKSRLVIHVPGSGIAIRFMSVQSPRYNDALVGFRGKLISELEVDKWLINYEKT